MFIQSFCSIIRTRPFVDKLKSLPNFKFVFRTLCQDPGKKRKPRLKSTHTLNIQPEKKTVYRSKLNDYLYINEAKNADCIASHLCNNWNGGYILEANPGPGILTKAILNKGANHLRVYEKNEDFLTILNNFSSSHSNLEIISDDIMFLPSAETRFSSNESSPYDNYFMNIPECNWEEGISFRFFSVISGKRSIKFLRYLLAILPSKGSIFSFGRCELFLLLPHHEYSYIIAEPKENFATYRWVTVLYRLFFDIECLEKFPSDILHPLLTRAKKATKDQSFYLMKLTPKPDLFSTVNGNKLQDFYFFVRHHLIKRTGLVIPTLEGWIPSCGPRLIKEGMHVFTKFGDLSPKQILMLFNQFSSWPEYEDSSFCAALHRYYGKCPLSYEEESNT